MKIPTLIMLGLLISGCGGSNNDDSSGGEESPSLTGIWKSNCYDLIRSGDGTSLGYTIDTYNFAENTYTLIGQGYTDSSCSTPKPFVDTYIGEFTAGDNITADDGTQVTRITMLERSEDWIESIDSVVIEGVYRISGTDLNFGRYEDGEVPTLIASPVYTKQGM